MDLTKTTFFNKAPIVPPVIATSPTTAAGPDPIPAPKAISLRPSDLTELSRLLGRNIKDADDLLLAARNVTTLSIKGLAGGDITLEPYLLDRLRSRCHPTQDFPAFVRERILELLAGYCGA